MCAKVAFMQLASCWGCHQSLLNSHLSLLNVLPELEIVYWPAVVDTKLHQLQAMPDKSVNVGFLEGFIRTQADFDNVNLMRKKCQILVAYGSCAVMGSVAGMANLFKIEDLKARKFQDKEFIDETPHVPSHHLPKLLDHIPVLQKVVKIDVELVGCPPVPGNILGLISSLLGQVDAKIDTTKAVCDVCPLKVCLLDQGKICFGPISAVGEDLSKLAKGYPLLGDFGLTKSPHSKRAPQLLARLTANPLSREEVNKTVEALLFLLKGPVALNFLDGRIDPIRQTKIAPDNLKVKKIPHPLNLDKNIEVVDYKLEGYPKIINDTLGAMLLELRNNPEYDESALTVCSSCPNNVQDKEVIRYKRDYEGFPDPNKCILNQGYVCMGPITRAGCGTICPKANVPCEGCYGPALNVEDFGLKAVSYFPAICKDEPENIKKFFKDPAGLFGRFTTVVSKLGTYVDDHGEKGGKNK
jgi:F420-non-reducing hydrogenase small subunit